MSLELFINCTETSEILDQVVRHVKINNDISDTELEMVMLQAGYWYCTEYHTGQNTWQYALLSEITEVYKPGLLDDSSFKCAEEYAFECAFTEMVRLLEGSYELAEWEEECGQYYGEDDDEDEYGEDE